MRFEEQPNGFISVHIDRLKLVHEKAILRDMALQIADDVTECKSYMGAEWYETFRYLWGEVHKAAGIPVTHHIRVNEKTKITRRGISATKRLTVYERDGFTCVLCGEPGGALTIDHIVPLARGGSDDLDNLQTACRPCNTKKGAR